MPPKEKTESTELQVFNLDNLNPALLPELATFNEIQLKVVEENPFVAIVDTASRELAKKHRTARVSARTALQNQDKLISSKFNEAKTKAKSYIAELIAITKPGEDEQQAEIDRDEAVLEAKRQEKARIEKERIDNIKAELDKYDAEWKDAFNLMTFQTIENIGANFLESYTTFDTTILQEFESLFPTKVEELTKILSDKTVLLTEAENARLEKLRLEEEAEALRFEKARLASLARIAEAADAKAKKEREDFEKEKAEFAKKQAAIIKKETFEKRKQILLDLGFTYRIDAEYNFSLEGVWSCFHEQIDDCTDEWFEEYLSDIKEAITKKNSETPIAEKVEIPEILVPENTTASVCNDLPKEIFPGVKEGKIFIGNNDSTGTTTTIVFDEVPTWDSIIEDFKNSGEKSYSLWLKNNYNVPTKIQ